MKDEQFDVVNERDEVVGQALRAEVHRTGLRHRAVHVLVFNRAGQVFLQKRSMTKDCHPGCWDSSASGHLGAGETYDAAAVREMEEELGWRVADRLERLFKVEACEATGREFVWVYRCEGEGPFRLHAEEIEKGGWFSREEVDRWLRARPGELAPGFAMIWKSLEWV